MCGIAGIFNLDYQPIHNLSPKLELMNRLQEHRGPDGKGFWLHPQAYVGFAHCRLSIIDLVTGSQPMTDEQGNWLVFNGEIYNYVELRQELGIQRFRTSSDTEVILLAYRKWGIDCLTRLRGMFAFALWDEENKTLVCARDRFGIKPFYYTIIDRQLYFASEVKALLPFLESIETDLDGIKDYLTFQFCLEGKTLFKGVNELRPGYAMRIENGIIDRRRFWEIYYDIDFDHTERYFIEKLDEALQESITYHIRSDVPIGAYISGGLDSSLVASLSSKKLAGPIIGFTGKFSCHEGYDESRYARCLAEWAGFDLDEIDITVNDFMENIRKVIYHLDYPVAGPGSFSQFMVSRLAARKRKVVLGGQGGDEIFGGYTRYLIAYFEQCIKAAIDGTMHSGNFIVTYESIIPNLEALRNYKPLLQEFWREGLFEPMDQRYFRLVNRANALQDEVNWELLGDYSSFETFRRNFNTNNVRKESYFDLMTHFDFKTLLPALLQVEDRVSMAHGLESRVPLLDHPMVELAATIPSNIKFKNGTMKHVFKEVASRYLPAEIYRRTDKMGFPTPLVEWINGGARDFVMDIFMSQTAKHRTLINNKKVVQGLSKEPKYSRKIWGLLSLELWQQEFHDRQAYYKQLAKELEG